MRDKTHVRLVDAHAERDRGDDDARVVALETRLVRSARHGIHAGVVRQRIDAMAGEEECHLVDSIACQAIDDAGLARVLVADEAQQLLARLALLDDAIADVGPVEAGNENTRLHQQAFDDFVPRRVIGGRGQRNARHRRKALAQDRERTVFRTKIVSPLRDAVRFVDGEQRDAGTGLRLFEQSLAALGQQALRRDVDEIDVAAAHAAFDGCSVDRRQRRIQCRRTDAEFVQGRDLVGHQRNQRRYNDANSRSQQRRDLVRKRFAATRGHQHQGVAAGADMLDHLTLEAAKAVVAEDILEEGTGVRSIHPHSVAKRGSGTIQPSFPPCVGN